MPEIAQAYESFRFHTRLNLTELTGLTAVTLEQLLCYLREVPGSSIYHHTHRFLQQHQHLSPEPPNDFAYWVTEILGEKDLGERLASIDTIQFSNIHGLREKIIKTIEEYLGDNPAAKKKFSYEGEGFHFMKSISFIVPTPYVTNNLQEFLDVLKKITIDSIYFHMFEARLRLERVSNDFSFWIEKSIGDKPLADKIARLDPYTQTLEDLRKSVIKIIEKRIQA